MAMLNLFLTRRGRTFLLVVIIWLARARLEESWKAIHLKLSAGGKPKCTVAYVRQGTIDAYATTPAPLNASPSFDPRLSLKPFDGEPHARHGLVKRWNAAAKTSRSQLRKAKMDHWHTTCMAVKNKREQSL